MIAVKIICVFVALFALTGCYVEGSALYRGWKWRRRLKKMQARREQIRSSPVASVSER